MPLDSNPVTIILVHGGALSGRMYKDMEPTLSEKGWHVLCPDLPGHGSSVPFGPFSFPASADFLRSQTENIRKDRPSDKIVIVGVSLGGQAVLHFLSQHPTLTDAAVVSGASINPPGGDVGWEMPHMPESGEWLNLIIADIGKLGPGHAEGIQRESLEFTLEVNDQIPPVLVVVGEDDVGMAKRDFEELYRRLHEANLRTEKVVLEKAWHNHPIDVPERFSELVSDWATKML
ncbi:Alpha/Beta hydrolase protein [Plectosphaerella plurivora]|uniref:Alpha/Beta hydrolase protein n=1 Tax=Plectosphaerella plurivora TaxID=936078 RepID=A0A9P9A5A4_9PEZI|nr:Alpha/Beta hydrolase protein [Plectosphaerella plurivora]